LAPLPLLDLPCNFSSVSLTCFFTSSSLGSTFTILRRPLPDFPLYPLPPRLFPPLAVPDPDLLSPGLEIRRRFFLLASSPFLATSFFFLSLVNFDKSILSPAILGPLSFL